MTYSSAPAFLSSSNQFWTTTNSRKTLYLCPLGIIPPVPHSHHLDYLRKVYRKFLQEFDRAPTAKEFRDFHRRFRREREMLAVGDLDNAAVELWENIVTELGHQNQSWTLYAAS